MSETTSRDDGAAVGALITPDVLATALAAVSAELRWPTCPGEACGQLVLDADEVVLRQVVAPALVREVQRLVRASATEQVVASSVPAPRLAVEQVAAPCDSCCAARATYALAYPDVRRRVCAACLPPDLLVVAELLEDDDDLAVDERPALERMAP